MRTIRNVSSSAVLSAGVLLVLALALSPFLEPSTNGQTANAAEETGAIFISVDGINPVGAKLSVPVGGEQDLTALRASDGQPLPAGEVTWDLACDGEAVLRATPGNFVATISVITEGSGSLRVSTADGDEASLELTYYLLEGGDSADIGSEPLVTRPANASRIVFQSGSQGVPLTFLADDIPNGVVREVRYELDESDIGGSMAPPYAVTYPDLTNLATWDRHQVTTSATCSGTNQVIHSAPSTFEVLQLEADGNGDGWPDDPFSLALEAGDMWLSSASTDERRARRDSVILAMEGPATAGEMSRDATVAIQDPDAPDRLLTVTAPAGLIGYGETGLLVVAASDSLEGLFGGDGVPGLPALQPALYGRYAYVGLLISADAGQTFREIGERRLTSRPFEVVMRGAAVVQDDNVRMLTLAASLVDSTESYGLGLQALSGTEWHATEKGAQIGDGEITTFLTSNGVVAPFHTPALAQITRIMNLATGEPSGFSVGGDRIAISLTGTPADAIPAFHIGGRSAEVIPASGFDPMTFVVLSPRAVDLPIPAKSKAVDVSVFVNGDHHDTVSAGFQYVGPRISGIEPSSGTELGGEEVAVYGEGLDERGISADLDGAPLVTVHDLSAGMFRATTTSHSPGPASIHVRTANGFLGEADDAYRYESANPLLSGVWPGAVPTNGHYRLRANGAFLDPAASVTAFFAMDPASLNPAVDHRASSAIIRSESAVDITTPTVEFPIQSRLYLVSDIGGETHISNAVPFSFVSPRTDVRILAAGPSAGPIGGGGTVEIRCAGFSIIEGGPDPIVHFGNKTATTQGIRREEDGALFVYVVVPPGELAGPIDIRVESPDDTECFAVLADGYTYKVDGAPLITGIEPSRSWVFGGTVVRIDGADFEPDEMARTRVYFDGLEAEYPAEDAGFVQSPEALYVVVPPMEDALDESQDSIQVNVAVVNPDGKCSERAAFFTYIQHDIRTETTAGNSTGSPTYEGAVATTAFLLNGRIGSGPRPILLDETGQEAEIEIPPILGTTGNVAALVRATLEPRLFQLDHVQAGTAVEGAWAFDIHLYTTDYPFEEILCEFDIRENPIALDFPLDGEGALPVLTAADLQDGGMALYHLAAKLDYSDLDSPTHALRLDSTGEPIVTYQWNVGGYDVSPQITPASPGVFPIQRMEVRADRLGSFVLCSGAYLTAELAEGSRYAISADSVKSTSYAGGEEITIEGRGLAWPESVRFGDVVAYQRGEGMEDRLVFAEDTQLRIQVPAVKEQEGDTKVDIIISLPQGPQKSTLDIRLAKQFTFEDIAPFAGILGILLGVPLALIGLLAGGKSGGGSGGPCFIATAAYGTPMAEQIDVLRALRDTWLLTNSWGTAFVDTYYRLSPPVADIIAGSPALAWFVRLLLRPVVALSRLFLAMPHVSICLYLTLFGMAFMRRLRKPRRRV